MVRNAACFVDGSVPFMLTGGLNGSDSTVSIQYINPSMNLLHLVFQSRVTDNQSFSEHLTTRATISLVERYMLHYPSMSVVTHVNSVLTSFMHRYP